MSHSEAKKLLLFTIGPVQKFIAQARKTQDLWSSSYLLSYLVYTAREKAIEKGINKNDFIFPSKDRLPPTTATFPNRLLFPCQNPKVVAAAMEEAVISKLKEICTYALNYLGSKLRDKTKVPYNRVDEHVPAFLTIFWAETNFNPQAYGECLQKIEQQLGGVKNLRTFSQIEELGVKCPLCGERQAIAPQGTSTRQETLAFWEKIASRDPRFLPRDTLCTICFGKRLFPDFLASQNGTNIPFSFPSTPEIAASSFKLQLMEKDQWNDFIKEIKPIDKQKATMVPLLQEKSGNDKSIDGHWLHRDNYHFPTEQPSAGDTSKEAEQLPEVYKNLDAFLRNHHYQEPSSYYAILFGDGDDLGKTIVSLSSLEEHREFSSKIADYAADKIPCIIEKKHPGQLIYAGGDDFAALLPLDAALSAIKDLHSAFLTFMKNELQLESSVSFGLCLTHYTTPFSFALNKSRAWLHAAKQHADLLTGIQKNTTGIIYMSHGGNHQATLVPNTYTYNNKQSSALDLLTELVSLYTKNILSKRFPMAVYRSFSEFINNTKTLPAVLPDELVNLELQRLLRRATTPHLEKSETCELAGKLVSLLATAHNHSLDNFLGFLQIGAFLSREAQL